MPDEKDEEEIREYAYALWQEAGSPEGREDEFWHKAKNIVGERKTTEDVDAAGEESFPASDAVNHM